MIIFSIVMAIAVIMFYFKSSLNFDKKSSTLKTLALVWIVLNALLIFSAFIKNTEYVSAFGLTYKRIGVYIFLALSLVGLSITYYKIHFKKTNFFLLNRVAWIFFATLVVSATVNFSWIVSRYNINYHKSDDIKYLRSLEFNKQILYDTYQNDPEWKDYFEKEKEKINFKKSQRFLSSNGYYYFLNVK
jgi:hypothetical protein